MLKLRRINKIIFLNYFKQALRGCDTQIKHETRISGSGEVFTSQNNISYRENAWREAQEKYVNHEHIIYSSFLESQVEHMSYTKKKFFKGNQENHNDIYLPAKSTMNENTSFPKNWMDDYEFYQGAIDGEDNINSMHGKSDPNMPPSMMPCSGCGAHLHCANSALPGYIPKEIFQGRSDKELQTIVCQRCHFLQHYNIALDVEVTSETYVETISRIQNEYALAVVIVDLLDFPCSIWPGLPKILGSKRPVFIVGNKVDLLPRDSNSYLEHVKHCLEQQTVLCGFEALNIKYVSLISAKTGYGIEELITQLHKIWKYNGDVYLLGCTNVGKSSLFNILLNSDYCRPEATSLIRKATTCPWPGTTLNMLKFPILRPSEIRVYQRFRRLFSKRYQKAAEEKLRRDQAQKTGSIRSAQLIGNVGRTFDQREDVNDAFAMARGSQPIITLNETRLEYQKAKWCYDTPGVIHPEQITNLLTTEELLQLSPRQMISPRAFRLKAGMSLFLAGLGRLDFIKCSTQTDVDWIKIFVFCSLKLPIVISSTKHAEETYNKYVGTEVLGVPFGPVDRLARWPTLQCKPDDLSVTGTDQKSLSCDIMLSSAGWIGVSIPEGSYCMFRAWTPYARGIYMRTPALIPYAERLIGKRIRNSLAYHMSKPFVFKK